MTQPTMAVGTAGWSIPGPQADGFPVEGTHLQRYTARLRAAEINSSFYKPHRPATYARWAASVPDGFRFAVKIPKTISHELRLRDAAAPLTRFLSEAEALEDRLGPLLLQLPPSFAFELAVMRDFLALLRERFAGEVVCEPRHPSWFVDEADALLAEHRMARVAADPPPVPAAAEPGGWPGLAYYRLHGSPEMYRSAYSDVVLDRLSERLRRHAAGGMSVWCIFDNTTLGAALPNALGLMSRLDEASLTAAGS